MNKETIDFIEKCNFIISINRSLIDKRNKLKVKHALKQNKKDEK
jgi:hypothetical protein